MDALSQFTASTTDARELKRALAVQMRQQGYSYQQVVSLLQVSKSFISKWQQLYQQQGINALKLRYWDTQGYLALFSHFRKGKAQNAHSVRVKGFGLFISLGIHKYT